MIHEYTCACCGKIRKAVAKVKNWIMTGGEGRMLLLFHKDGQFKCWSGTSGESLYGQSVSGDYFWWRAYNLGYNFSPCSMIQLQVHSKCDALPEFLKLNLTKFDNHS